MEMPEEIFDKVVKIAQSRGFVFNASSIYGGLRSSYDYGPLGVLLKNNIEKINDCNLSFNHFDGEPVETLKKIAFEFDSQYKNLIFLSTSVVEGKPLVLLLISKNIINKYGLKANEVINKLSVSIDGAGGGQDFLATAGGKNIKGIDKVIRDGRTYFNSVINN